MARADAEMSRLAFIGQPGLLWPGWLCTVAAVLVLWIPSLLGRFDALSHPPESVRTGLEHAYVSAPLHAGYHASLDLAFGALCIGTGTWIVAKHRGESFAVAAAFAVVLWGIANGLVVESFTYGGAWRWVLVLAGWVSWVWLLIRARRMHRLDSGLLTRQTARWTLYGMGASVLSIAMVTATVGTGLTLPEAEVDRHMTGHLLATLYGSLFPVALGAAWLHPTQPDPDTLIRRTLVYGGLSSIVVGASIAFVILPAFLYPTLGPVYVLSVITAWAVVGLQLQGYLQKTVNRLLYGQRDEPMSVLSDLGDRLELGSPETVLETIVETVATSLKLPYVSIEGANNHETLASQGASAIDPVAVPILHQRELVGRLLASPRARDEPLHDRDLNILRLVARQAGPTVRAVQLNLELRRSRREILVSREEERRRIRRDLHDGLGPALAAIAMQADTARAVIDDDPLMAKEIIGAVTRQAEDVVNEVRRVVYDLRPPALDEVGLAGSIERLARQSSSATLRVEVVSPGPLPPLDAAVEVAVFRIAAEALTNVVRHSAATECTLTLVPCEGSDASMLCVSIMDDGVGMPVDAVAGVGLRSMRDRAGEVGGTFAIEARPAGTLVTLRVPTASQASRPRGSEEVAPDDR